MDGAHTACMRGSAEGEGALQEDEEEADDMAYSDEGGGAEAPPSPGFAPAQPAERAQQPPEGDNLPAHERCAFAPALPEACACRLRYALIVIGDCDRCVQQRVHCTASRPVDLLPAHVRHIMQAALCTARVCTA
jgi:hypothetical protein